MMIGSDESIQWSLADIWQSWYTFRRGKKRTAELDIFSYFLEGHLSKLHHDLTTGIYQHGLYKVFNLIDTKKRTISVASIRDRVAHRMLYEYLVQQFDKTFISDAWSCRRGKGLLGAIFRTQQILKKYPNAYVWRGDIAKFFDSIDQNVLGKAIKRKVNDRKVWQIIDAVIKSYNTHPGIGIPIGNLTSQIFTNIYLNELDFYILHTIKPLGYLRYGDDFILIIEDFDRLDFCREHLIVFIDQYLKLTVHSKNNIIVPVRSGVHFLGCDIYPSGRRLRKKIYARIRQRLNLINSSSYRALVLMHSKKSVTKWLDWNIIEIMTNDL